MRFKLLIAPVISNSCITSTYFYILGEGNECGHRVRQIWRRGPRQYWPYEGGECPYGIHRAEKDHMFFLCYYTPEKQNSTSVTGMKNKKNLSRILFYSYVTGAILVRYVNFVKKQRSKKVRSCATKPATVSQLCRSGSRNGKRLQRTIFFFTDFTLGCSILWTQIALL